jgi:aspartyl-tRNA synthetase
MERTDYDGELRLKDVGKKVTLVGWVAARRNLGAIEFIDLRDKTGIVQLTVPENVKIPDVRNEYVVQVKGKVGKKLTPNPKLKTGRNRSRGGVFIRHHESRDHPVHHR